MKEIGGYFSLERTQHFEQLPKNRVNSGRTGLELILRQLHSEKIFIPYFTCEYVSVFLDSIQQKYECYHLDKNFEIENLDSLIKTGFPILYTNYFGIKDEYCDKLQTIVGKNLILDLTQALHYQTSISYDVYSFSSCRKIIGVPDGGFVTGISNDIINDIEYYDSIENCKSLLLRANGCVSKGYSVFKETEELFVTAHPFKMSKISEYILNSISLKDIEQIRNNNFSTLKKLLNTFNFSGKCPMIFPYITNDAVKIKKYLIDNKIFIPTYWPNLIGLNNIEQNFIDNVVCIPIDQRYNIDDMIFIYNKIMDFYNE